MVDTRSLILVCAATMAIGGIGYAVYFDQKRRTNPKFRKQLKKKDMKIQELVEKEHSESHADQQAKLAVKLATLYDLANKVKIPDNIQEMEPFLFQNLQMGETYAAQGPEFEEKAVVCLYTAVRICASPMEVLELLAKSLPSNIMDLLFGLFVMQMKGNDAKYYEHFPDDHMNVKLVEGKELDSAYAQIFPGSTRALVSIRNFEIGEIVYEERPLISNLNYDLEGLEYCSSCLKQFLDEESNVLVFEEQTYSYCSQSCKEDSIDVLVSESENAAKLYGFCKKNNCYVPYLVYKFLIKIFKQRERAMKTGEEKILGDIEHVNKLLPCDLQRINIEQNELAFLQEYLAMVVPNAQEVINEEYYGDIKAKFLNNVIKINGTDDFDFPDDKESVEGLTQLGHGSLVGVGLFIVSSYLKRANEEPNVRVQFVDGDKLQLITITKVEVGDILMV